MPHSLGCEATDWLRGIWSSCKRFRTWSQCCHFGWSPRCSDTLRCRGLHCSVGSGQYTNDVFIMIRNIDLLFSFTHKLQ